MDTKKTPRRLCRLKSPCSPPPPINGEARKIDRRLVRAFPLLLLTVYAATTLLRLLSPLSPANIPFISETAAKDSDPFKTHIHLRKSQQLHAQGEEPITTCQELIDGKPAAGTSDDGLMCCDRSHHRTDVCYLKGDVRTHSNSSSVLLVRKSGAGGDPPQKIRPYTRKWEAPIMSTIDELTLRQVPSPLPPQSAGNGTPPPCDVRHSAPAVVLSTGGYTGNVYHEFNDGLLPLYVTAQRFAGEVVLVVLEYHEWWAGKYGALVEKLTKHELVDFRRDRRVHCFPEMIVGLKIHGELSVEPRLMPTGKGIQDFQVLLGQAFGSHPSTLPPRPPPATGGGRPKIVILVRDRSRVLLNLQAVIRRCKKAGFRVATLRPRRSTPLPDIYGALSTADAVLAVHGAAVTHFLFMRPGATLVQVVPLGLDWAAEEYYGRPAKRLGLNYVEYRVAAEESSLLEQYSRKDPVIADPAAVTGKGWQETKRIYLEHQNVTIDLRRFGKVLAVVHSRISSRRRTKTNHHGLEVQ